MLESGSLYFTRADCLGDPFEGSYSRGNERLRADIYKEFYKSIPVEMLAAIRSSHETLVDGSAIACGLYDRSFDRHGLVSRRRNRVGGFFDKELLSLYRRIPMGDAKRCGSTLLDQAQQHKHGGRIAAASRIARASMSAPLSPSDRIHSQTVSPP